MNSVKSFKIKESEHAKKIPVMKKGMNARQLPEILENLELMSKALKFDDKPMWELIFKRNGTTVSVETWNCTQTLKLRLTKIYEDVVILKAWQITIEKEMKSLTNEYNKMEKKMKLKNEVVDRNNAAKKPLIAYHDINELIKTLEKCIRQMYSVANASALTNQNNTVELSLKMLPEYKARMMMPVVKPVYAGDSMEVESGVYCACVSVTREKRANNTGKLTQTVSTSNPYKDMRVAGGDRGGAGTTVVGTKEAAELHLEGISMVLTVVVSKQAVVVNVAAVSGLVNSNNLEAAANTLYLLEAHETHVASSMFGNKNQHRFQSLYNSISSLVAELTQLVLNHSEKMVLAKVGSFTESGQSRNYAAKPSFAICLLNANGSAAVLDSGAVPRTFPSVPIGAKVISEKPTSGITMTTATDETRK
ncbi:hypothetical protein BDR26DRAFT_1003163 [Obelidium mucronatum]|nr:hypothetical protein BDR26DRAFT_1003163 [Obelidium mucronatum]